jgi:PAS domain S-box-containing protein
MSEYGLTSDARVLPNRGNPLSGVPQRLVALDAILCTERLYQRPKRAPDYEAENRALTRLVQALADAPSTILQVLAETILAVLKADSAGLSLLTPDGESFHWPAIAGDWRPHVGGGTPRNFGPCGDVLDRNTPLLFTHWERRYPYLVTAVPLAEEGLLVPFHVGGKAVGTIWAIAHDDSRKFDAEDLRLLESLGRFASGAYQAIELQRAREAHRVTDILMAEQGRLLEETREREHRTRELLDATRAAERALQQSESQKAAILQSALDAIVVMDEHGRIADFNPAAARLFGYDSQDMIGKSVAEAIMPERLRDAHRRGLERFLQSGQSEVVGRRVEMPARRRDGSEFPVELSIAADRLPDGRIQFIGCLHDITERKRTQDVLQRLATIVESSDDAIVSKNLDGIIQTWNAGAERIFGYKAEEVIGKPVTVLMPPERYDEEPAILARLRRGERIDHYETVRRRKDGRRIDVSLTVSPVKDHTGRIIGASKIARDITEQKRAEAELRASERRLHDLLAAIPAAIYTTDAAGKITYYNEAAVELAGRRPTIGSDHWCVSWKLYWPDGTPLPHDQCPMAVALKEGRPVRGTEAVAERPDGTRVPFIPFPTPLYDASGKVVGAINMLVDISERKQAETQQRVLHRELNHRVRNNMQMLHSLLHAATTHTQSAEAKKVLNDAASRVSAMAAAQQVLYRTSDASRFSAREFLDAVCQAAQQTLPTRVTIVPEAATGEIDNDDAMPLALILNELMTNAFKYGCAGDGDARIRVGLTNEDGQFVLYVEDGGPGFDLEEVAKQSSGLKLVQLLARQVRGHLEVVRKPASRCSVRFS